MHGVYKKLIEIYLNDLKDNVLGYLDTIQIPKYLKSQEPSNIREIELSIEIILKFPCNSIGKMQESQENHHGGSTKEFISCCDAPLPYPPSTSMDFQEVSK